MRETAVPTTHSQSVDHEIDNDGLTGAARTLGKPIDMRRLNRTTSWKLDIAAKQRALSTALLEERAQLSACPICGSDQFSLFVEIYGYPYSECTACGHIFSQCPPTAEAVRRLYAAEKRGQSIQAEIYTVKELFNTRVELVAAPKVDFVTQRVSRTGRWADIGCGVGDVVVAARTRGWDAFGVDSDPEEVVFARSMGADVDQAFIKAQNVGRYTAGASVVSLFNVVEHLLTPQELLSTIAGALESAARVVLEVPRHPSLSSLSNRAFPDLAGRHIYPPDHLHVFTETSLGILLNQCGLIAEHVWLFGQDFHEVLSSMATHGGFGDAKVFDTALEAVPALQNAVDQAGLSDTMLVIARER